MDMGKAALAALACLAFLDAVSAVTLDKVTANEVSFSYQDVENRGGMGENFDLVIFTLSFSGDLKLQKGAETPFFLEDDPTFSMMSSGPPPHTIDATLKCGPNDELVITTEQPEDAMPMGMYAFPPQSEIAARVMSQMLGIPSILPVEAYAKDELVFGAIRSFGPEFSAMMISFTGADPFATRAQYLTDACSITVGGGFGEYKIVSAADGSGVESGKVVAEREDPASACSVDTVQSVLPILREAQTDMATAVNKQAFTVAHKTSMVVQKMDGLRACKNVLDSMMGMGQIDTWVPYTRMCVAEQYSDAWRADPCCNGVVAFNQCCAPRNVEAKVWAITDIYTSSLCQVDETDQCMLDNALLGWQILQRIIEDPAEGCKAQREKTTNQKEMDRLNSFWDTCYDILFSGKTKDGRSACTEDSQCYTKCSKKDSKCTQPWWDFEQPFVACAIDNMDQVLINYFRSQFNVNEAAGPDALSAAIYANSAKSDCTGDTADEGACMIDATEEECSSGNFYNLGLESQWVNTTVDSAENCTALGTNYVWIDNKVYGAHSSSPVASQPSSPCMDMDCMPTDTRPKHPAGCINTGEECQNFANDQTCNYYNPQGNNVCDCVQKRLDFVPPDDCQPGSSSCGGRYHQTVSTYSLGTEYRSDSPVVQKCKLQNIWPDDMNATCGASCQCALYRDILARENSWGATAVPGDYLRFKNTWSYVQVEGSDQWAYQQISTGNQTYCEWDKKCAHRPYDNGVTEAQCLAAEGTSFCAECDGPFCYEMSTPSKCMLSSYTSGGKASCLAKGGSWVPPADAYQSAYCWDCCRVGPEAATRASCFPDNFCPFTDESWTYAGGRTITWKSHGFCEYNSFCYNTEAALATNKTACDVRRMENIAADSNNDWPQWYANASEIDNWQQTDMYERWGQNGQFGQWRTYWQNFVPTVGMCVEGAQYWDNSGVGIYTQATCEADAASRAWFTARRFSEGQWDTQETCTRGVCNSQPWDWELAKSGTCETDAQNSGVCSRPCKLCEAHWESGVYEVIGQQLCHASWLWNETACMTAQLYVWDNEGSICYSKNPTGPCATHPEGKVYKCGDLDTTECNTLGLAGRPWYNGEMTGLLKCHVNNYGVCPNKAVCENGGTCNDWTYELWEGETEAKCRVPWATGSEWGGPAWESCPMYPQAQGVWDDACVWQGLTLAECTAKGGTQVSRAETSAECTQWKGCFHSQNYITAIAEGPCTDDAQCSVEDYQWHDVLDWRSGVWTPSQMVSREWKAREMTPRNKWGTFLSWNSINMLVTDAVYAIMGRAYVNEALCSTEPLLQVFESLACACGADRNAGENADYCAQVKDKVHVSKIAEATSWRNIEARQVIKSAVGTIVPDKDALAQSGNATTDKVETYVSMISAAMQRLCLPRGDSVATQTSPGRRETGTHADTHPMRRYSRRNMGGLQNKCEQYEVVKNAAGEIVGQLIGNGMVIEGLKGGTVRTCLKKDPNIPICLSKFETTDVSKGGGDNKPGVPMQATVTTEGDRLCITVTLPDTGTMTLYPILRTQDLKPYVAFVGEVVKAVMKLNIASKELVTLDVMRAFKVSVAKVLQGKGLSAVKSNSVVILKVCDDAGCVEYTDARRAITGGVSLSFRVNAVDGVDVTALKDSMGSSDFVTGFVSAMAAEGHVVEAEFSGLEQDAETEPDAGATKDDDNEKEEGPNVGLIVGLVVGGVALLAGIGAGVFFFMRQQAAAALKASEAMGTTPMPTQPSTDAQADVTDVEANVDRPSDTVYAYWPLEG